TPTAGAAAFAHAVTAAVTETAPGAPPGPKSGVRHRSPARGGCSHPAGAVCVGAVPHAFTRIVARRGPMSRANRRGEFSFPASPRAAAGRLNRFRVLPRGFTPFPDLRKGARRGAFPVAPRSLLELPPFVALGVDH